MPGRGPAAPRGSGRHKSWRSFLAPAAGDRGRFGRLIRAPLHSRRRAAQYAAQSLPGPIPHPHNPMVAMLPSGARRSWSTADVESRHALSYWVDTICKSFLEIDIDSPHRERFHGRLDQFELGPATVNLVEADTQSIRRTPARIARSQHAGYFLLQLRSGRIRFHQYGRECCIEPGDSVLVDCKATYRLDCLSSTRSVALRLPHEWLKN